MENNFFCHELQKPSGLDLFPV